MNGGSLSGWVDHRRWVLLASKNFLKPFVWIHVNSIIFLHSSIHSFIHSFIHSLIISYIHLFIHSFVHSFVIFIHLILPTTNIILTFFSLFCWQVKTSWPVLFVPSLLSMPFFFMSHFSCLPFFFPLLCR